MRFFPRTKSRIRQALLRQGPSVSKTQFSPKKVPTYTFSLHNFLAHHLKNHEEMTLTLYFHSRKGASIKDEIWIRGGVKILLK